MAIATLDQYIASAKSYFSIAKTSSFTTLATAWFTSLDVAGKPGAGVLAAGNTANGVLPTDAAQGFPDVPAFGGGATGYLSQVDFGNTVSSRLKLFDLLFKAGAYAYNSTTVTNLASQPNYLGRTPGGAAVDTQLWLEVTTAFATGTAWQVTVTYTNQAGTTGKTTTMSSQGAAALPARRLFQIPLAAGDSGVQKIESIVAINGGTAMTAGAFNILVLRPLWSGRVRAANDGDVHEITKTGMPVVYDTSAIFLAVCADSTSSGLPELEFVIANG